MAESRRLLGYFEVKLSAAYRLKVQKKKHVLAVHPFVVSSTDIFFGVSKTVSPETLLKLRKANATLTQNGTYRKINRKWNHWLMPPVDGGVQ